MFILFFFRIFQCPFSNIYLHLKRNKNKKMCYVHWLFFSKIIYQFLLSLTLANRHAIQRLPKFCHEYFQRNIHSVMCIHKQHVGIPKEHIMLLRFHLISKYYYLKILNRGCMFSYDIILKPHSLISLMHF